MSQACVSCVGRIRWLLRLQCGLNGDAFLLACCPRPCLPVKNPIPAVLLLALLQPKEENNPCPVRLAAGRGR